MAGAESRHPSSLSLEEWCEAAACTPRTAAQVWASARARARGAVRYDPARWAVVDGIAWSLEVWEKRLAQVEDSARIALDAQGWSTDDPEWPIVWACARIVGLGLPS